MVNVQLPDGTIKEYPAGSTPLDVAQSIGPRLAKDCLAAEVDGKIVDLRFPLPEGEPVKLKLLTEKNPESLGVMRHSAAHVMARAVMRLFPDVNLAFGPTLPNGFYYDFDMPHRLREEDFAKIEAEMLVLVKKAEPFERFELPRGEAVKFCGDLHQELKVTHINTGLADHQTLSFYRQGEFVDLCRGPHIPDASRIKAFKLLSVAAAHFKGDATGRPLQRLYGTAFFSQKDLEGHMKQVEEARRRDHRVIGKQHALFHISQDVGQGLVLWLPKGAIVRSILEEFIKQELLRRGYQPVYTPHIGRVEMYETSGHFPYYRDAQFAPIFGHTAGAVVDTWITQLEAGPFPPETEKKFLEFATILGCHLENYPAPSASAPSDAAPLPDGTHAAHAGRHGQQAHLESPVVAQKLASLRHWQSQQERYLLKPMNCPHHVQIYKSQPRSYRDLPVRLAEFGTVYRHEQSGELNGLLRVRGLTQDDAHLFCTPEQVEAEFRATIELVQFVLTSVGLNRYRVQLSLRDPKSDKYVGSEENWAQAEASLRKVLDDMGLPFEAREGEAAFYGPKADFMVRDCIGREWQLGTVQLDYNLPERFGLEYIGTDNRPHRPVMIHRAPFGSMERFMGVLIEHFAGAFPLWLAPEQLRVLPISEKTQVYAVEVEQKLKQAGFRCTVDLRPEKVGHKIRDAQLDLIPYMLIVGPEEAANGTVALRDRIAGDLGTMSIPDAIARLSDEITQRVIRQVVEPVAEVVPEETTAQNEY